MAELRVPIGTITTLIGLAIGLQAELCACSNSPTAMQLT
jgi:hypothetical protein